MGLFCLLSEGGGGRSSQIARKSLISTFQVELSLRGAESLWIPTWSNFDNAELLSTLQVPIAANNHVFAVFEKKNVDFCIFTEKGRRVVYVRDERSSHVMNLIVIHKLWFVFSTIYYYSAQVQNVSQLLMLSRRKCFVDIVEKSSKKAWQGATPPPFLAMPAFWEHLVILWSYLLLLMRRK